MAIPYMIDAIKTLRTEMVDIVSDIVCQDQPEAIFEESIKDSLPLTLPGTTVADKVEELKDTLRRLEREMDEIQYDLSTLQRLFPGESSSGC